MVDDVAAGPCPARARSASRSRAAAVNFPDVLLVAGTYQIPVPPPFVPGSELAGVVVEVGRRRRRVRRRRPGDGHHARRRLRRGGRGRRPGRCGRCPTACPSTVAAAFGVAHRTACHVLRSIAQVAAGRGAGRARRRRWRRPGRGAARRAARGAGHRGGVVAREARGGGGVRRHHPDRPPRRRAAPGRCASCSPAAPTSWSTRSAATSSEPALRALRWGGRFVTVGYASGEIPRIPLNLVLLKGVQVLGFQFIDFATHRPDELEPQRGRAGRAARRRAGPAPRRRHLRPRRHGRGAAAGGRRRGDRQGRDRRAPRSVGVTGVTRTQSFAKVLLPER